MRFIKPYFEIWEQEMPAPNYQLEQQERADILLKTIYRQIEKAGRTCYKSEDKITEDSATEFVNRLIESKHYAMLEHGTVYMTMYWLGTVCDECNQSVVEDDMQKFLDNPYCKCVWQNNYLHITTNLRVIAENDWWEDMRKYICLPTKRHAKRVTVHFVCNRQVSHEFVRHRVFSFAQESTRYCNYTKDKFGNELTFIEPCWDALQYGEAFSYILEKIEMSYNLLIAKGWKPQQAANILPNAIKTELVMTGYIEDWKHFFDLRALGTTGAPHPQAKELALPLYEKFKELEYID